MPPKNASKGGANQSKKADAKKKERIIEDKTFGLKNKKGSKQQKFIQQVEHQVKSGGIKKLGDSKEDKAKKVDDKKLALAEINSLFRPVQVLGSKGSDPKSILCAFFKQGNCGKANKCKFSHDLDIERKSEKRSAYVDIRDDKETSEDWDEAKLKEVVEQKHGKDKNVTTTEIVCRYFLDAVEGGKYGWFWECPNGGKCIYRHALPAGFVLKKDRKKMDTQKDNISLEELIERERAALGHDTTKVTLETFLAWKKKKIKDKENEELEEAERKKIDYKSGKEGGLSGREMFTFNPDLAVVNDDEFDDGDESIDIRNMETHPDDEEHVEQPENIHYKEITFKDLVYDYLDVQVNGGDNVMSIAAPDRLKHIQQHNVSKEAEMRVTTTSDVTMATATTSDDASAVAIDEDLFDGDDDLDDLDDEFEDLNT